MVTNEELRKTVRNNLFALSKHDTTADRAERFQLGKDGNAALDALAERLRAAGADSQRLDKAQIALQMIGSYLVSGRADDAKSIYEAYRDAAIAATTEDRT